MLKRTGQLTFSKTYLHSYIQNKEINEAMNYMQDGYYRHLSKQSLETRAQTQQGKRSTVYSSGRVMNSFGNGSQHDSRNDQKNVSILTKTFDRIYPINLHHKNVSVRNQDTTRQTQVS